ncbi:MAG: enoyl-CoA hydratase/isomerase family protein [Gammaproteobacteria bacterium]|nr:enoyl-CoA hydratase/isomerase family protein [Gammaproteobacteria bacterium]
MSNNIYSNWDYELDADNILWLAFDRESKSVNSLSQNAVSELSNILTKVSVNKLENINSKIAGLIIYSHKKTGFIAGADVSEFTTVEDVADARALLENGRNTFRQLEDLKIPTVAMIDGFCLGGGCELILSCDYRLASDSLSTKIGLPEVMLGIIPGWGGTVRLPRLIGGFNALPLMMQGRTVSGIQAYKMGLVDACVPLRQLRKTAKILVTNKSIGSSVASISSYKKNNKNLGFLASLSNQAPFRSLFCYFARRQLSSKIKEEHYPAPYAILNNFDKYGVDDIEKSFRAELDADLKLIEHSTTKNLLRVYFLQEKLKEFAKKTEYKVKHVHVIGAGTMGGDIAAWCAFKGIKVTLQDQTYEAIAPAIARAFKLFKSKVKKDNLANLILDKIIPDVEGQGIKHADLIIEAIFEDLKVKQDLFARLEKEARKDAILATNTSSILLDDINQVLTDRSRLVGIHFFNPVAKMMLVEVVKGEHTDDNIANLAHSFVNQISKLPLPVASSPGFLVNRVLSAYMHETFILLSEGFAPELIDKAMKKFGMPMGPVEMADIVGLDICLSVAKNISAHYSEDIPEILKNKVAAKELGKKTNKGFYNYRNGKLVKADSKNNSSNLSDAQKNIIDRLTMRIVNICITCLREEVVADGDLIDAGLIFGAGFAPLRGGPINYLGTLGIETVIKKLQELEKKYGQRFTPDSGFTELRGQYAEAFN